MVLFGVHRVANAMALLFWLLLTAASASALVELESGWQAIATSEDMARLFAEGGHGKDSIKVNVHSTGYGLYIAKQIVEAHGGQIFAESEGAGKGSRFIVQIPAA